MADIWDDEESWIVYFDFIYSHTLVWPTVPPRPAAVDLWVTRLVEFEVLSRLYLCKCLVTCNFQRLQYFSTFLQLFQPKKNMVGKVASIDYRS
jgi:hypothetical protein